MKINYMDRQLSYGELFILNPEEPSNGIIDDRRKHFKEMAQDQLNYLHGLISEKDTPMQIVEIVDMINAHIVAADALAERVWANFEHLNYEAP